MRVFKWQARWVRVMLALTSIVAFAVSAGAGWRWD
jgi:hypothetical protein